MGKDKTSAEGFIGGDDSTLYLDNDVYKSLQAKLKRSAEALVFDKSAFDLESKVCGTEGMLLLASYWHSVVESSDLLRDFLVNDVDKCLSDIQRSINQTDEECARSFNLEEPEDGAKASVLAQMGDIGPSGKFQKAVVRGISEDVKKPTLDEILRSTAGTDKHKKMREGAKLLAAFAGDIEKPIEDAGNKVLNFLNKNSVYRDLALPGLSNIFTLGAGIQSYLETGGFGDTEKNTRINLAAFQRGGLKAGVESVTGLMKMPDLAYKIGNGLTGVMNEGARYIKESGVENLPEDLAAWAGEKGAQAKAIYNVIKDSASDKLKGMSVEEYYEASGDVAANVVMFFAGGGSGAAAKGGEAAKAGEAAEKTAATMEEFLQLADKTDDVVKFADTASDATKLADAAGDVAKIAEEAGDVAKIADGTQTVSKIADTAADVAQGAEKAGSTAEAFVSKVDDVAEVAAEEADDVARAAEKAEDISKAVEPYEVTTYDDFRKRSVVGDGLEGHEMWQHSNMKANGHTGSRLSTNASKNNPVMALPREVHAQVSKQQRLLDSIKQTPLENILSNADIMYGNNNIPNNQIDKQLTEAIKHLENIGGH